MGMLKKLRKKGKNQSKDEPAGDNDAVVETEEVNEPEAEPAPKEEKKTADELVAAMFSKQNLDESKKRAEEVAAEMSSKPKQSADDRVAQMFAKSKSTNEKDTVVSQKLNADELVAGMRKATKTEEKKELTIGKTTEKNKAIEALIQKQHHDPKGFIDSNKGATKIDSADGFAERKKIAEDMAQRKGANEKKITVDVSNENFGNKYSFAMRREILESKAQGQKMPTPTNERQSGLL